MHEFIYLLTIVYAAYVIDDATDKRIANIFHLDLSGLRSQFGLIINSVKKTLGLNQKQSV